LGLSVCNQIIHVHKGDINIESEKGVGTIVTVNVPRRVRGNDEANIDY
jgi:signal transduction histidine kinase